jgi:tetratricopeptide (TPR) repeat protein
MIDTSSIAPQAHAHFHQQEFQKAIGEFTFAISQQNEIAENSDIVYALKNDLAVAYLFASNFDKAISLLEDCKSYYEKTQNHEQLATVYANLASVYEKKKKISQAISHYLQSLDHITETEEAQQQKYFIHYELAKLYLKNFNFVKVYAHYVGAISYKTKKTLLDKIFLWITTPR